MLNRVHYNWKSKNCLFQGNMFTNIRLRLLLVVLLVIYKMYQRASPEVSPKAAFGMGQKSYVSKTGKKVECICIGVVYVIVV